MCKACEEVRESEEHLQKYPNYSEKEVLIAMMIHLREYHCICEDKHE